LYPVDAVLLEDAVGLAYVRGEEAGWPVPARARWTAPDGHQRTGDVVTDTAADAGTVIVIWTDVHGDIVDTTHGRTPAGAAVGAGLAVTLGVGAVYTSLLLVIRRTLHRRRMASWQLEWTVVEPRWSGRRSHGTTEGTEVSMASKENARADIEPLAALAGIATAMMVAARHTRGTLGTAGRRAAEAGGDLGRRAWSNARDSGHRAA